MSQTTTLLAISEAEILGDRKAARLRRRRAARMGDRRGIVARTIIAIVVCAIVIFPLYWMLVVAFSPRGEVFEPGLRLWPSTITFDNFAGVLSKYPVIEWFGNSVVIGAFVTVFTVAVNLLAGYAFARLEFKGRNVIFLLALATMMIPVQAIMVAQFKLVSGLGIYGTYWGVILPGAAAAFGIFLARQFFLSIPDEIIEAARIDGAGHLRIFLQVVLPLCKPLVAVLTLLTLMGSWNDFAWPLIALKDNALFTLPIGLLYLKGQTTPDYNAIMALALISVIPMVLLFLFFQRYFVQGFARSGIKVTLTYLSTLDLPDEWFDELARRVPGVRVHRASGGAGIPTDLLASVDLLHTSEWFPDAADVPSLRCVQLDTSGVDHVRRTTLWHTEIPIATLGGIAPVPMAEYALMAMLELAHRMPLIQQLRDARAWPGNAERLATLTPRSLPGATVGIVGYGRIGREIARLSSAFGMQVLGLKRTVGTAAGERFDTGRSDRETEIAEVLPFERLDELMRRSDFLVVVVPLTELSRGMIGAAQLDLLPRGAFVVNIARGGIVDEQALIERLRDGRVGGVALDVFDDEPLPADSPWWNEPAALLTPHVAGLAPQYHAQTLDLVVENLSRLADGRPILNEVDRVTGY